MPAMTPPISAAAISTARPAARSDAFNDFQKAIQLDTTDPRAYHNRGLIYQSQGQHAFAIEDFSTAISLSPDAPEPYNGRGLSYLATERRGQRLRRLQHRHQAERQDRRELGQPGAGLRAARRQGQGGEVLPAGDAARPELQAGRRRPGAHRKRSAASLRLNMPSRSIPPLHANISGTCDSPYGFEENLPSTSSPPRSLRPFSPLRPAPPDVKLGLLTCDIDGGTGTIIASHKGLSCTFKSIARRRQGILHRHHLQDRRRSRRHPSGLPAMGGAGGQPQL